MCQAGETLLALVGQELGPVNQALVDLLEGFGVVGGQADSLPPFAGHVGSFDGLHVEVHDTGFGVGSDSRIPRVCQGAGLAVAKTADIVFIATEGLVFCGSKESVVSERFIFFGRGRRKRMEVKGLGVLDVGAKHT